MLKEQGTETGTDGPLRMLSAASAPHQSVSAKACEEVSYVCTVTDKAIL